jgi:hypothetical protein
MGTRRSGIRTRFAVVAAVVGVVAGTAWAGLISVAPAGAVALNVPCSGPGGGAPGLIAAINAANAGGGGTINLASGCTYVLTQVDNTVPDSEGPAFNGLPVITSPIRLNGSSTTIERSSAAPPFRILYVTNTGTLTLNNLTITGGLIVNPDINGGGGILNHGELTLNNSRVTGNNGGALGGGGIFNGPGPNFEGPAVLTLNNSRVDHNTTSFSGFDAAAIFDFQGTTTLNNSEVDSNQATVGGGIFKAANSLTLNNSRLHDNTAEVGAGIVNSGAAVHINASQITNNTASSVGGGIFNSGAVSLGATSVTSNTPDNCFPLNSIPGCIN